MTTAMTTSITTAKIILAGTVALCLGSAAWAQQALTGTVTQVNRLNGTVAIRQTQDGTVGATPGAAEEYKTPGPSLENLHAGDAVTFSVSEAGGVKTITKIDRK